MTVVQQNVTNGVNLFKVKVNKEKLSEIKNKLIKTMNEKQMIKGYELLSSWRDVEEFEAFMLKSCHKQYDFYFNESVVNSGGNDYMRIIELGKEDYQNDYFEDDNLPTTFEIDIKNLSKNKDSSDTIAYDSALASEDRAKVFFAITRTTREDLTFGGCHSSVGYRNTSLVQIPPALYYTYKLLEGQYLFINEAIEKGYNVEELLNTIDYTFIAFIKKEIVEALNTGQSAPVLASTLVKRKK